MRKGGPSSPPPRPRPAAACPPLPHGGSVSTGVTRRLGPLPPPYPGSQWPMAVGRASAGSLGLWRHRLPGRAGTGDPEAKACPPATTPGASSSCSRARCPTPPMLCCSACSPAQTHLQSVSYPRGSPRGGRSARPGHNQRRGPWGGGPSRPRSQDIWVLGSCLRLLPAERAWAVKESLSLGFLICC